MKTKTDFLHLPLYWATFSSSFFFYPKTVSHQGNTSKAILALKLCVYRNESNVMWFSRWGKKRDISFLFFSPGQFYENHRVQNTVHLFIDILVPKTIYFQNECTDTFILGWNNWIIGITFMGPFNTDRYLFATNHICAVNKIALKQTKLTN